MIMLRIVSVRKIYSSFHNLKVKFIDGILLIDIALVKYYSHLIFMLISYIKSLVKTLVVQNFVQAKLYC